MAEPVPTLLGVLSVTFVVMQFVPGPTARDALAGSPGRVFSRAQLLEKVWGYDFFGDERVVDVHIRGMRKALGDDAAAPRIIGTVRSVGYKFLLDPVEWPGMGGGAA